MSTTYTSYPACFFKDDDSEYPYTVIFPDLERAFYSETLDKAFAMAQDALALYFYIGKEDGTPVPARRPLKQLIR